MPEKNLEYDNSYWKDLFGPKSKFSKLPEEKRLQLLFSLLVFLNLSLAKVLRFFFTSEISKVKERAAMFMRHTPSALTPETQFPPFMVFTAWHKHFPTARASLHDFIVRPCAMEMAAEESNKLITCKDLKIKVNDLTVKGVQNLLKPNTIKEIYQDRAPFVWDLLVHFTSLENKYRRRLAKKGDQKEEEEDWDDDPNLAEDEPESKWRLPPNPEGFLRDPMKAVLVAVSMLIFARNRATNGIPLILGLFCKINGTKSRVMRTLSNVGLTVSGRTIERVKKVISVDAITYAIELVMSDNEIVALIFDNINIFQRKAQQRITNLNSMINATNSALIAISRKDIDAARAQDLNIKLENRGLRVNATLQDIMPTTEDDAHLETSFTVIIAQLLTLHYPGSKEWPERKEFLSKLGKMMPQDRPLPVQKTDARPLGVVDVNEGSKHGIVNVLKALQERMTLTPEEWSTKTRLVLGDWLTSNNLRAARRDREDESTNMGRIDYVEENSMLWHFCLQNTHAIVRTHLGNAIQDPTSLSAHKDLLRRVWDTNKPNYAAAKSLIRHSLIARLVHIVMAKNGCRVWSEARKWQPASFDELIKVAKQICSGHASQKAGKKMRDLGDDWMAHDIYFIRDALLFCEFEQAISFADAGRVLRVMKYWAFSFRGCGQHNYARECAEVLVKWKYELDNELRKILERSWFYNRWGLPGQWIPTDLYVEQLNFWVKCVEIASGNGVTIEYIIEKGSACIEAMRDITEDVSRYFGNPEVRRKSKEVSFEEDMRVLVENMEQIQLHQARAKSRLVPSMKGSKSASTKSAIIDVQVAGAEIWQSGKFTDFLKKTTYDKNLGYPVETEDAQRVTEATEAEKDPLGHESYEDLHGDETNECGLSSLGGGEMFSTGEIIV
ncbi:hypothetical protein NLJ89_g1998 [Agrocybe chaxingu]|uniref:DUF6589 domain-containing protein n=1 Tax=Agrocybe chaxingu TaxID=84603 RepID=A0A9W8MYZ6_9AGAR|nr:hypothetical protein NLJ89_g1998 [Agrocybe chaxingu]